MFSIFVGRCPNSSGSQGFSAFLSKIATNKLLDTRVHTSCLKAKQTLRHLSCPKISTPGPFQGHPLYDVLLTVPSQSLKPHLNLDKNFPPTEVYPDATFLTTVPQVEKYLISRNNRGLANEVKYWHEWTGKIVENFSMFEKEAALCEKPAQQIPWLINRIGPEINYLFVGEEHGNPEIHRAMIQLLHGLRQKYPQRHIVLVTEFLPNIMSPEENLERIKQLSSSVEQTKMMSAIMAYGKNRLKNGVWEALRANNIDFAGLEPAFVYNNENCAFVVKGADQNSPSYHFPLWVSDEGTRLRHLHWERRIHALRQKYPDALFVVYGGRGHFDYYRRSSIAKRFPRKERVLVRLLPLEEAVPDEFIQATNYKFLQRTLYWQSEHLASLAGFDYQFRVLLKE